MTEIIWDGKYKDGKKVAPVNIALPFQNVETVNESTQQRQTSLDLFSSGKNPNGATGLSGATRNTLFRRFFLNLPEK